jgi:uncharacterized iron-regulated membrane protein
MKLLAFLHRWAGGVAGLLLAVIGLSGAVLVWEDAWIGLPGADDPLQISPAAIGDAVAVAMAEDPTVTRVTFADEGLGLHHAAYADGSGAYLTQGGQIVDRWESMWGRPELWLFDLHHYLFLGETGEYVTGTLGLLLFAFSITGLILWWRTRKTFKFRLWPARLTRSAIVRQHRDIGAVASPLLILAALTGSLMIFKPLSDALLSPWASPLPLAGGAGGGPVSTAQDTPTPNPSRKREGNDGIDWRAVMKNAQAAFPDAVPRRLMLPKEPGAPLTLRMKQDFEWTPNGRTYVYLDPASAAVIATEDPAVSDTASAISEKYYPVHAGKVGGTIWRLLLTFTGLTLTLLGTLATWSFWFGKPARPQPRPLSPAQALAPAE